MKFKNLELADCSEFIRFERGNMLYLLIYSIEVYYGRIDNFQILE